MTQMKKSTQQKLDKRNGSKHMKQHSQSGKVDKESQNPLLD